MNLLKKICATTSITLLTLGVGACGQKTTQPKPSQTTTTETAKTPPRAYVTSSRINEEAKTKKVAVKVISITHVERITMTIGDSIIEKPGKKLYLVNYFWKNTSTEDMIGGCFPLDIAAEAYDEEGTKMEPVGNERLFLVANCAQDIKMKPGETQSVWKGYESAGKDFGYLKIMENREKTPLLFTLNGEKLYKENDKVVKEK